jgi:hypothetical protein
MVPLGLEFDLRHCSGSSEARKCEWDEPPNLAVQSQRQKRHAVKQPVVESVLMDGRWGRGRARGEGWHGKSSAGCLVMGRPVLQDAEDEGHMSWPILGDSGAMDGRWRAFNVLS